MKEHLPSYSMVRKVKDNEEIRWSLESNWLDQLEERLDYYIHLNRHKSQSHKDYASLLKNKIADVKTSRAPDAVFMLLPFLDDLSKLSKRGLWNRKKSYLYQLCRIASDHYNYNGKLAIVQEQVESRYDRAVYQMTEKQLKAQRKRNKMKGKIGKKDDKIKELEKQLSNLQKNLAQQSTALTLSSQESQQILNTNEELKQEGLRREAEIENLKNENLNLTTHNQQFQTELVTIKRSNTDLTQKLQQTEAAASKSKQELSRQLATSQDNLQKAERNITTLTRERNEYQFKLRQAENNYNQAAAELRALKPLANKATPGEAVIKEVSMDEILEVNRKLKLGVRQLMCENEKLKKESYSWEAKYCQFDAVLTYIARIFIPVFGLSFWEKLKVARRPCDMIPSIDGDQGQLIWRVIKAKPDDERTQLAERIRNMETNSATLADNAKAYIDDTAVGVSDALTSFFKWTSPSPPSTPTRGGGTFTNASQGGSPSGTGPSPGRNEL